MYRQDLDPASRCSKSKKQDTMKHMKTHNRLPIESITTLKWRRWLAALVCFSAPLMAMALPADFSADYEILDSRQLSISGGAAYVIQDGQLVIETMRNRQRPYCRALQSTFDESRGSLNAVFVKLRDGTERATLKTIPTATGARPTVIECYSEPGFFGTLDIKIALGQIINLSM